MIYAVVTYCVLAAVLSELNDSQRDGCDRANDRQLESYIDLRADAADNRALAGQEHDPEISAIYLDIAERKDARADRQLAAAEASGFQDDLSTPTLSCADAYPLVLPWIA